MLPTNAKQDDMLRDHERRLAALEYNLRRLMETVRLAWEEPPAAEAFPPDVLEHLARGDKLQAIKALVDRTGMSLADAKNLIERGRR